jgi:hypothetical protein
VRSLTAQAHRDLVAAESLTSELDRRGKNIPASRERLDSAWRLLALAEVSDATGINPFRGEVEYGIAHAAEGLRIARDVIAEGTALLGYSRIRIDTDSGSITSFSGDVPLLPELAHALLAVTVDSPGRTYTETWQQVSTDPAISRVELTFSVGDGEQARRISVEFPGSSQNIVYCPALQEETPVSYPRSDFVWDHFILALPNGMIGLDEGRFVIKDTGVEHVGAFIYPDRGDITFADETAPVTEPMTWVFYLVEGSVEDAVKVANGINIRPTLYR